MKCAVLFYDLVFHYINRTALTIAVVGSAVVVRKQVSHKRNKQADEGIRPTEILSWEEWVQCMESEGEEHKRTN